MTTQAPSKTLPIGALLAAHRALREAIAGLSREAARVPPPDWAEWCAAVSLRIRILRAHLKSHFAQEEAAGLVEQIEAKAPEHSGACERLLREHASLLARLDTLAMGDPDAPVGLVSKPGVARPRRLDRARAMALAQDYGSKLYTGVLFRDPSPRPTFEQLARERRRELDVEPSRRAHVLDAFPINKNAGR